LGNIQKYTMTVSSFLKVRKVPPSAVTYAGMGSLNRRIRGAGRNRVASSAKRGGKVAKGAAGKEKCSVAGKILGNRRDF